MEIAGQKETASMNNVNRSNEEPVIAKDVNDGDKGRVVEDSEDGLWLLWPPGTKHKNNTRTTHTSYGTIQERRTDGVGEAGHVRQCRSPHHSRQRRQSSELGSFSAARARVVMLIIFFCYQVSASSVSPLQAQYFHSRFKSDFFNETDNGTLWSETVSPSDKCDGNDSSHMAQQESKLQKHVSKFQLFLSYVAIGPMIVSTLVLGSLSDVIGRRVVLLLPCLTLFLKLAICLLAMKLDLPLWTFYVANVVDGLSGSFCTVYLAGFALTADISPPEQSRTLGVALAESILSIADGGAQLSVGYILQNFGFFYGSIIPTVFSACGVFIGIFFLPETVSRSTQRPKCPNPFHYLKNVFGVYIYEGSRRQRAQCCLILLIFCLVFVGLVSHSSVLTLFQLNLPFCWTPQKVGTYGATSVFVKGAGSLLAVYTLQKYLSDPVVLGFGIMSLMGQFVLEGLAKNDLTLYFAIIPAAVGSAPAAVSRSMLSKLAGADKQGALFASIALVETLSTLLSSTLYNAVYEVTVAHWRGAVFLLMAAVAFLDLCLNL